MDRGLLKEQRFEHDKSLASSAEADNRVVIEPFAELTTALRRSTLGIESSATGVLLPSLHDRIESKTVESKMKLSSQLHDNVIELAST